MEMVMIMAAKVISNAHRCCMTAKLISTSTANVLNRVQLAQKNPTYTDKEAKKIGSYFLQRYVNYIKNSNKIIEQRFPNAISTYRVFVAGLKEFYLDLKEFVSIVRIINFSGNGFKSLTRKEIELYHQMPKDMLKVAPILFVSALPLTNYIVFPLVYLFPRQLLTSHFWNLQQKSEFKVIQLKDRLLHNRPVFRHLQGQVKNLKKDHTLRAPWKNVLGKIGSGVQPPPTEIVECKDLFAEKPYELNCLSRNHMKHLLKMHDMRAGFIRRRARLRYRAKLLLEMDKAIMREGGVHNLPSDALRNACFIRGLNPLSMRNEELITWLKKWMEISRQVNDQNLSLLLHSPILLGYNEQTNWTLIYPSN